jgi:3-oxoadipate enol-lactonase
MSVFLAVREICLQIPPFCESICMDARTVKGTVLHAISAMIGREAPTLVFINSLGTDFRIWDGVRASLGQRAKLVLHDKRGHCLSLFGKGVVGLKTYADDL